MLHCQKCQCQISIISNYYNTIFLNRQTTSQQYLDPYGEDSMRLNEVNDDLSNWKNKKGLDDVSNDIGWKPYSDSPKNLERPKVRN